MKKLRLLVAVCASTLVVLANTAHAVTVNPILGLDIGGTLYDVTFNDGVGDSFNALWDADDDGVFGGGGSVFTAAPTFWGDQSGAEAARDAIIAALGTVDTTTGSVDGFFIPYGGNAATGTTISAAQDTISFASDNFNAPSVDNPGLFSQFDDETLRYNTWPIASFQVSAVPIPAAVWLFGSGLLGLVGMARRKKVA
jgi:hypothetical protein